MAAANQIHADALLVSATRITTLFKQLTASATLLDKADLDRAQNIGLSELLLRTPDISMSRNGGMGTSTSLRIRGVEVGQTVVVIDDVKMNDPSNADGSTNFSNLLPGNAARVKILRGPQSILWGSQAIGGVISIETALPERDLEGSIDLEAGSRNSIGARAAVGGHSSPVR